MQSLEEAAGPPRYATKRALRAVRTGKLHERGPWYLETSELTTDTYGALEREGKGEQGNQGLFGTLSLDTPWRA